MRIDYASKTAYQIVTSTDALPRRPQGIYVGVTGDVVVRYTVGGADVTFVGVPAGTVLPISPAVVTACSDCVAL